jgi:hypothetical protein
MSEIIKVSDAEKLILTEATAGIMVKLNAYVRDIETFIDLLGKSKIVQPVKEKDLVDMVEATKNLVQALQGTLDYCSTANPSRYTYEENMILIRDEGEMMASMEENHLNVLQSILVMRMNDCRIGDNKKAEV